jgi:CDP-diacylglycerol--glycerol-3-phosphate 3-phosphatidyltransferase
VTKPVPSNLVGEGAELTQALTRWAHGVEPSEPIRDLGGLVLPDSVVPGPDPAHNLVVGKCLQPGPDSVLQLAEMGPNSHEFILAAARWRAALGQRDTPVVSGQGSSKSSPRTPRARDLPGPRRGESVTAPLLRWVFQWPYRFALAGLYRLGLRAWHLTAFSLVAAIAVGALLFAGLHLAGAFALIGAGLLDLFDGALARLRGEDSPKGALLDSVVDRVADTIVYGSLFISEGLRGAKLSSGLAFGSLVVGLLVSHLRAQAEASGATMTEGMFQRPERVVVLVLGLIIPGALVPALAILSVMGALTVAQRLVAGWRRLPRAG